MPLYSQLAEQLLAKIHAGEFVVGARIPSEHSLAASYEIGRPTVRQATEMLIRRGYLERRRGSGTFVCERQAHVDLFSLGGTLESFSRQGLELDTRLHKSPHLIGVSEEKSHPLSGRSAYYMERVGSVKGEPILLEEFFFDAEVFPFFDQLKVAGRSLSEAVRERYRLEATSAEQRFSVDLLNEERAELLGLSNKSPVLQVDRTLHFPTASKAVFARMRCRSDRFSFSQRIGGEYA